jgi:predicted dithiol-disulfide oxidoreductase (DUF899 family)
MAKRTKSRSAARRKKPASAVKPTAKAEKSSRVLSKLKTTVKKRKRPATAKSRPREVPLSVRIETLEKKILQGKKELAELRKRLAPEEVSDYVFKAHDGSEAKLSEMFGTHKDLILVHNMGKACRYCTLWADGFVGLTKHLEDRAGFVVISKDDVDTQREFYRSRGWNFKMYSSYGTSFSRDMKFEHDNGAQMPGVSSFYKDESGKIFRVGYAYFGPGDDFCALWHMLDLIKDGSAGWEPKYDY